MSVSTAADTASGPPSTITSAGARRTSSARTTAGRALGAVSRTAPPSAPATGPAARASAKFVPVATTTRSAPSGNPCWVICTLVR